MELTAILVELRKCLAFDLEENSGRIIRKQVYPDNEDLEQLLRSMAKQFGTIRIVPKRKMGNASVRNTDNIMTYSEPSSLTDMGLSGINAVQPYVSTQSPMPMPMPTSGNNDIYRILWEQEKQNSREWRDKYEHAYNELNDKKIELAESKSSTMGSLIQGVGSVIPAFMGGMGGNGIGQAPQQQQHGDFHVIKDKRLAGITVCYNGLPDEAKSKLYTLMTQIFQNPEILDTLIELSNE